VFEYARIIINNIGFVFAFFSLMLKRLFFLLICLLFCFNVTKGQTQGCYLSGVLYNSSGAVIPTACGWVTPKVVNSNWSGSLQSQCSSYGGVAGGYVGLGCPLDDYIPFIIVLIGAVGFIYIRNNRLKQIQGINL
jgi:hypothetical protein